jgi:hypothetical protein
VELGDVVTVGQSQTTGTLLTSPSEIKRSDGYRSVPSAIENGTVQRATGGQEQGGDQDIWQVLDVGDGLLCRILDVSYVVDHDVYSKLCDINDVLRVESIGAKLYECTKPNKDQIDCGQVLGRRLLLVPPIPPSAV